MPKQNVELVHEVVNAVNRRDILRLIELTDPEVEWQTFLSELREEGAYRGHDGIRQWLSDVDDVWEFLRVSVDDTLAVGESVLVVGRLRYRGKGSGVELDSPTGWVAKIRRKRLVSARLFREPEAAIESLGLGSNQASKAPVASSNLELVRSAFAAWERGDVSSAEWAHPEIEFVVADGPTPTSSTGLAAMATGMREFLSAWADWRVEADEYQELDGGRVLVLQRYSARGKASGVDVGQVSARGANLFHVRDGKVTRLVCYFDRERALTDLGLSSQTSPADT
jgi:ketosteroid isomerase-like protein